MGIDRLTMESGSKAHLHSTFSRKDKSYQINRLIIITYVSANTASIIKRIREQNGRLFFTLFPSFTGVEFVIRSSRYTGLIRYLLSSSCGVWNDHAISYRTLYFNRASIKIISRLFVASRPVRGSSHEE